MTTVLRLLLIGLAALIVGLVLEGLGVPGAGWLAFGSLTLLAFALYVVPWILEPPKLRDLAVIAGLFVAAIPMAFVLDALGAPPWIALLLLAAVTTAYVLISEHLDELAEPRGQPLPHAPPARRWRRRPRRPGHR